MVTLARCFVNTIKRNERVKIIVNAPPYANHMNRALVEIGQSLHDVIINIRFLPSTSCFIRICVFSSFARWSWNWAWKRKKWNCWQKPGFRWSRCVVGLYHWSTQCKVSYHYFCKTLHLLKMCYDLNLVLHR